MKQSPLFVLRLNKLIARTMRQVQLATCDYVKLCLRHAVDWLNRSRQAAKALDMPLATMRLSWALSSVKSARSFKKAMAS